MTEGQREREIERDEDRDRDGDKDRDRDRDRPRRKNIETLEYLGLISEEASIMLETGFSHCL